LISGASDPKSNIASPLPRSAAAAFIADLAVLAQMTWTPTVSQPLISIFDVRGAGGAAKFSLTASPIENEQSVNAIADTRRP
jgi:hypothetical protein